MSKVPYKHYVLKDEEILEKIMSNIDRSAEVSKEREEKNPGNCAIRHIYHGKDRGYLYDGGGE